MFEFGKPAEPGASEVTLNGHLNSPRFKNINDEELAELLTAEFFMNSVGAIISE